MKKTIPHKAIITGLVMLFVCVFFSPFSLASELDDIRVAIKGKNAKWIAGETSVSQLPLEHRKLRVGLTKPEAIGAEGKVEAGPAPAGAFDWTTLNFVTPVRDQGSCGSCWAFATAGALESFTLIKNNSPLSPSNVDRNLSEQILVSCSGAGNCDGGDTEGASSFIRYTGLPLEACYPYSPTNGNCANACYNWWKNDYKIGSWTYVATTLPTVEAIKSALYAYGPLVTSMRVYSDFYYYTGGTYAYSGGDWVGDHAILIVGYDDTNQRFHVKNSWGTGWGVGGFFYIDYSELNSVVQFGQFTIAYLQEAPEVAAGGHHTVGLRIDGTAVAVGDNGYGQLNVGSWGNIMQVAAGPYHTVGLRSDGMVVAVGDNGYGQLNVGSWGNIMQVAVGSYHTVGLKSDGTVVAVGDNGYGQLNVGSWGNIMQVAVGPYHTVGLKSDGTVVAVGDPSSGKLNVGSWSNVVQVAAGDDHTVGLKSDQSVVAVGDNTYGQLNTYPLWGGILQVAAGGHHTVGLKIDGKVLAVGDNRSGQLNVRSWSNVVQVAAGYDHTVGLKSDGTVVAVGNNDYGQLKVGTWKLNTGQTLSSPHCMVRGGSYTSIQSAYNAAVNGDTIQCQEAIFDEDLAVNRDVTVTLEGGYDAGFTGNAGRKTTLKGMITTTKGKITISNFNLSK